MATYVFKGEGSVAFPTLKDADGNVLVVSKGDVFEAPEGLEISGVEVSTAKIGKAKVADPEPTPVVAEVEEPEVKDVN